MSAELTEDIVGLVDAVVRPLVEEPEALDVQASIADDGTIYVDVAVASNDTGKVIGRQGRVIKSIRTLARALASREGLSCEVELVD